VALWLQVEHVVLAAPQGRVQRFVEGDPVVGCAAG